MQHHYEVLTRAELYTMEERRSERCFYKIIATHSTATSSSLRIHQLQVPRANLSIVDLGENSTGVYTMLSRVRRLDIATVQGIHIGHASLREELERFDECARETEYCVSIAEG